jgi:hypothetical protein
MGNAYDSASLLVTPNGYKASKIYSAKPTDGTGDLTFSRASTAMRRNSAGLWEEVASNVPRLQYPVGGGCPSWLFEPQATNEALYSNQIDNAYWGKLDIAITANAAIAPDGTTTAESAVLTGTGTTPRTISRLAGVSVSNATVTFSCFVKYVDRQFIQLVFSGGFSFQYANFDVQNGTVTDGTYTSATIENNGNGWYRISVTTTGLNTTVLPFIWAIDTGNAARAADSTSTGTQSYLLWNIQIETGTVATSPIITAGSAVTRLADDTNGTGISSLIGQTEGTMYWEGNLPQDQAATAKYLLQLSGASPAITITTYSSVINILSGAIDASVIFTAGDYAKIAVCYNDSGNFRIFVNGSKTHDLNTFVGAARTSVAYGVRGGANDSQPNCLNKKAILYKTALSDSEAIELTTL